MGLRLFLVSLGLFFAGSLLVFILTDLSRPPEYPPVSKPPPLAMWLSTALLLLAGMAVEGAAWNARRGRVEEVRRWVKVTFLASIAFVAVQSHAILRLFHEHELSLRTPHLGMEGVTFCLIAIHAAHVLVLGGLVPLGALAWRATFGRLGATTWSTLYIIPAHRARVRHLLAFSRRGVGRDVRDLPDHVLNRSASSRLGPVSSAGPGGSGKTGTTCYR